MFDASTIVSITVGNVNCCAAAPSTADFDQVICVGREKEWNADENDCAPYRIPRGRLHTREQHPSEEKTISVSQDHYRRACAALEPFDSRDQARRAVQDTRFGSAATASQASERVFRGRDRLNVRHS